jgi:hypothetical protein
MVRAKFRCMSITQEWTGHKKVSLQPVMKSEKHPENASWSQYTPSGDCDLTYGPKAEVEFTPGDYYFIDMELTEDEAPEGERLWKLYEVREQEEDITVKMSPRWAHDVSLQNGSYEATISNKKAWPHYRGKVGSKWLVTFSFACSSADGEE